MPIFIALIFTRGQREIIPPKCAVVDPTRSLFLNVLMFFTPIVPRLLCGRSPRGGLHVYIQRKRLFIDDARRICTFNIMLYIMYIYYTLYGHIANE